MAELLGVLLFFGVLFAVIYAASIWVRATIFLLWHHWM